MTSLIVPGNRSLTPEQQQQLDWIVRLRPGRDVVIAIDLTESVGLNDPGRMHLRQIIERALKPGDTVHIMPFATTTRSPIAFEYRSEADIPDILEAVPMNAGPEQGTDIQCAELDVYRYLAQLNQDRLLNNQPIKPQSVVWLTDAPLDIPEGESQRWIEAPNSPCGVLGSPRAQERTAWMNALPMEKRQIELGNYQLTVVDIPPIVQEFCSPQPGGGEICLVDEYISNQLGIFYWGGAIGGIVVLSAVSFGLFYLFRCNKKWSVQMSDGQSTFNFMLRNHQSIGFGGTDGGCIGFMPLPGAQLVGKLVRQGTNLKVISIIPGAVSYQGNGIMGATKVQSTFFTLNCDGVDLSITVRR